MSQLNDHSAVELSQLLASRKASALEVLDAHVKQIERVNPKVNAIVTLDVEGARAQARAIDERRAKGERLSPLAGLPIAVKDMEMVRGMRTTKGSPIFKDWIPDQDTLMVERFRKHGMPILGKTNTPEFALGSQTFNTIFGATRNPWDLTKTCGGSSGGAAVATATHMLPFADGSDLGASLRNPGSFCNVIGLRPTPGRVPVWPGPDLWLNTAVHGPIGRTAADTALLLYAQSGGDRRSPTAIWEDPLPFIQPLDRDFKGVRVAFSRDLGGLPTEHEVLTGMDKARQTLVDLGCTVEDVAPDLREAEMAFDVLRALLMAQIHGETIKTHRHLMKDTAIWNIERGLALTVNEIVAAKAAHNRVYETMRRFMERYDFFVLPTNQVLPFSVDTPYPTHINGVELPNYLTWMQSCYFITMTAHPALSVPVAFSSGGLPIGGQIVGRYRDDLGILQLAHAVEKANGLTQRRAAV